VEKERLKREQEEYNKRQEALQIRKMRKQLVHKPQPIMEPNPIHIRPSVRKVTDPIPFRLATEARLGPAQPSSEWGDEEETF